MVITLSSSGGSIEDRRPPYFERRSELASIFGYFTAQCTLVQLSAVLRSHVVRLSVRPSVTLVICDHVGWKSWKLHRLLAQHLRSVTKRRFTYSHGNIRKFWGDMRWGREKVAFWRTKAAISRKRVKIE